MSHKKLTTTQSHQAWLDKLRNEGHGREWVEPKTNNREQLLSDDTLALMIKNGGELGGWVVANYVRISSGARPHVGITRPGMSAKEFENG